MYISLSLVVKNIKNRWTFCKVTSKKVDCLVCPVRLVHVHPA